MLDVLGTIPEEAAQVPIRKCLAPLGDSRPFRMQVVLKILKH